MEKTKRIQLIYSLDLEKKKSEDGWESQIGTGRET